ncbi:MAG: hypothetical protein L0Z50_13795, partial [Verrucomicrobiales bacterium]|nr:hypothetical protein [Verrucomicrobiales bacterium]
LGFPAECIPAQISSLRPARKMSKLQALRPSRRQRFTSARAFATPDTRGVEAAAARMAALRFGFGHASFS